MGSLGLELFAHGLTSLVDDLPVPGAGGRNASRKDADVVGETKGQGAILEAETVEAESFDGADVANAWALGTSHHQSLLVDGQLVDEGLRLLESLVPTTVTSDVGRGKYLRRVTVRTKDRPVGGLNVGESVFVAATALEFLTGRVAGEKGSRQGEGLGEDHFER